MNQTQIDKCEKIFNHYGREKQLIQLQEELGELQAAVAREIAGKENNMDEELADSLIMLEQFYLCDTKTNKNIDIIINDKLNRQINRIFGESYPEKKKMTEQEIINALKENKNEGKVLSFMPEDIQKWCEEHKKKLLVWQSNSWYKFDADDICTDDAVTLPDDYKVKQEQTGEWIVCEIKKNDCFFINGHYYHWSEWNTCLTQNHDWLKAFGGWKFKEYKSWHVDPILEVVTEKETFPVTSYVPLEEVKPLTPEKIRFWRES